MPAQRLRLGEVQELNYSKRQELQKQLETEINAFTDIYEAHRDSIKEFMIASNIWHISMLDYNARDAYEAFLKSYDLTEGVRNTYISDLDRIKLSCIREQAKTTLVGKINTQCKFDNQILFLPYHPDPEIAEQFVTVWKKRELVWDFQKDAPLVLKRQMFDALHYVIKEYEGKRNRRMLLVFLGKLYDFCFKEGIQNVEYLELEQINAFYALNGKSKGNAIVDIVRKAIFIQAVKTNWKANVWYLDRFHFETTRVNPSNVVRSIPFLEVKQKRNRDLLQQYMKYNLGITHLTIMHIQSEFNKVKNFLIYLQDNSDEDVCKTTEKDMEKYFHYLESKGNLAKTYNEQVISILHFFDFLRIRGNIKKIPFQEQYYLKKVFHKHHDRSVEWAVYIEIMQKLYNFPEDLRLMILHLWATGLRASEVCTLKGDTYYVWGQDAWMKVYQIKMKNYKRIPIPQSLYKLMKVYLAKHEIAPEDYIFQNQKGGAYYYETFRKRTLRICQENEIANGEYLFHSHDYRHTIAGLFYDNGASIQAIRDYLGHVYEEMTQQYIDFMPRRIEKASEEYFSIKDNLLLADLKRGTKDGNKNILEKVTELQRRI